MRSLGKPGHPHTQASTKPPAKVEAPSETTPVPRAPSVDVVCHACGSVIQEDWANDDGNPYCLVCAAPPQQTQETWSDGEKDGSKGTERNEREMTQMRVRREFWPRGEDAEIDREDACTQQKQQKFLQPEKRVELGCCYAMVNEAKSSGKPSSCDWQQPSPDRVSVKEISVLRFIYVDRKCNDDAMHMIYASSGSPGLAAQLPQEMQASAHKRIFTASYQLDIDSSETPAAGS